MVDQALKNSLAMKIARKKIEIAQQGIAVAENQIGPGLNAELEVSEYAREGATRDDWRASLYFDIPLYSGNTRQSSVAVATSKHTQALSELKQNEAEVRLRVLQALAGGTTKYIKVRWCRHQYGLSRSLS